VSASARDEPSLTFDRFAWPLDGDRHATALGDLGVLPEDGPLGDFRRKSLVLSRPPAEDPSRPWVLAVGERVIKAYDLRAFDAIDRRRALAEAQTALSVAHVSGVVTTHRAGEVGDWLVIEMERLGETVGEYLQAVATGKRAPLAAATWGRLVEEVARALHELHRRRLVHRDIKPANLMFDRAGNHLIVGDFSIASKRARRSRAGTARRGRVRAPVDVMGTQRYIAPEHFRGELSPAADQYALAVTADEALAAVEISEQARQVLLRATSQAPEDRFATIVDFAIALRAALDDTAPRLLSSRLQRVAPAWRHTWGSGAAVAVAVYALMLWRRDPRYTWWEGLALPLVTGALTIVLARVVGARLGGKRTQPRLPMADRPWFAPLWFAVFVVALTPLIVDNPSKNAKYVGYAAIGALAIAAVLGSTPRDAGGWLIAIVRRWEEWRERQRGHSLRWWGARFGSVAALGAVISLPMVAGHLWPRATAPSLPGLRAAISVTAAARTAMLAGDNARVCRLIRVPAASGMVACATWAPIASRWLRQDARRRRMPRFTEHERVIVSYNAGSERFDLPSWSLRRPSGDRPYLGSLVHKDDAGPLWTVSLTRSAPSSDPMKWQTSVWNYEVFRYGPRWFLTSVEVCDYRVVDPCLRLGQIKKSQLSDVIRRGAPH
jgi:serine/threonine protein kinase